MKAFQNSIMTMPIKSCKECPHRISKAFKAKKKYYTDQVCSAITKDTTYAVIKGVTETMPINTYPSVSEQVKRGGYLPECPLADFNREEGA